MPNMLQQCPEYKRLPLHRIHCRRLSAKDFDHSAPDAASHASSTFPKSEPAIVTQAPPTPHGGMYYDEPHHHHTSSPHNKPVELATTLWPPEATNYWFPNWKELFHGFLVVQKGQTRQGFVAESEQRGGILCIRQQKPDSHLQSVSTHLNYDKANTSLRCIPQPQLSQQQHLQAYTNDTAQAPLSTPLPSQDGPLMWKETDRADIGDTIKASTSLFKSPGIVSKCSIRSPLWLPQGWSTELHVRRTGTTAGTHDKYFKHLASGRRFRSRKDVLHFTNTGKGRARKQSRSQKGLMYSAGHSILKNFAHKKLTILGGLKPSPQSGSDSIYATSSLHFDLSNHRHDDGLGLPCKQLNLLCSSNSIQPPGRDVAPEKEHKLPVTKKAKTSPPEIGEDGHASNLWQWLTKPVARDNGTPLNREILTVSFSRPDVEKESTEMADEQSAKDHRANQLSKEIQAAHDDVVQMSREMQATVEKLSKEILVARKDVKSNHEMQASPVPTTQTLVVLDGSSEANKGCKQKSNTLSTTPVTSFVVNQSSKPGVAPNKLAQPAQFSSFANDITICGVPEADHTSNEPQVLFPAVTCMPATSSSFPMPVYQSFPRPNIIMHPEVPLLKMAHAPMETETRPNITMHPEGPLLKTAHAAMETETWGDAVNHLATQPAQTPLVGTFQKHVVPDVLISHQINSSLVTTGDVAQPTLQAEVPMFHGQFSKTACGVTKTANGSASTTCEVTQLVNDITNSLHITRIHNPVANNNVKQPEEVAEVDDAQATRRQTRSMDHPAQLPDILKGQAASSLGICANTTAKCTPGILSYGAQVSGAYFAVGIGTHEASDSRQSEVEARRLRRKKFSAVLNPKLDLSRLSPSLTTRQRAKVVEKMKARHARELLAALGKRICRKAVRRKPSTFQM